MSDKIFMEMGRNKLLDRISGLIEVGSEDAASIKIVNITILYDLLDLIPEKDLEKYISDYSNMIDVPEIGSPQFGSWLKSYRQKLGLTQKELAERLASLDSGFKFHAPDIANFERGKRLKDYRPARRERFKKALLLFRGQISKNTTAQ